MNSVSLAPHLFINNEPVHEIFNNVVCATSKGSDQPAPTRSLIKAFASRLEYSMNVKLMTEHHLEFLSLKVGCTGSYQSTLVKVPHSWKSHALAQLSRLTICRMRNRRFSKDIRAINFRFRKEDPQKVNKQRVLALESR